MRSLKGGCVFVTLDKALFVSVARKYIGEYYCLNHECIRIFYVAFARIGTWANTHHTTALPNRCQDCVKKK